MITGSLNIKSGTGSIIIDHASLPTKTMQIYRVDSLSIEFNLEDTSDDANKVFYQPSKLKFSAFDNVEGDSLFNLLDSIPSTSVINIRFDFNTGGPLTWTDFYQFTTNDIEFDRIKRIVTIKANYLVRLGNKTMQELFDSNPTDVETISRSPSQTGTGFTTDCMAVASFAKNVLDEFTNDVPGGLPGGDVFKKTPVVNMNTLDDIGITGGAKWIVMADMNEGVSIPDLFDWIEYKEQRHSVDEMFYMIASLDGSIVGTILGEAFIIGRNNSSFNSIITPNDVLKLKIKPTKENYLRIAVIGESLRAIDPDFTQWFTGHAKYGSADGLNDSGTKVLMVSFKANGLWPADFSSTDDQYYADNTGPIVTKIAETISKAKAGTYAVPLNQDPGLSPGDIIAFSANYYVEYGFFYIVSNYDPDNRILYFDSPLQEDLPNGKGVYDLGNTWATVAQNAVDGYAKSYGATSNHMIEMTINDISKLKPYETIKLSSGFSHGLSNKIFRPSKIDYDLEKDTVKVEAYEI